jgi:hypothetical protein
MNAHQQMRAANEMLIGYRCHDLVLNPSMLIMCLESVDTSVHPVWC